MSDIDLDTLLDSTLDDLADLPSFKPFTPGVHKCLATFSIKEVNKENCVELELTMVEPLELANPEEVPPEAGDKSSTLFKLSNEFGQGNMKKCAKPFQDHLGLSTIRQVIDTVKNFECVAVTGIKTDKEDADKKYLTVKEIQIV